MKNKNDLKEEIVRYQNTINSNTDDVVEEKNNINIEDDFDDGLIDSPIEIEPTPETHRRIFDYDPFDDLIDHPIMKVNDDIVIKKGENSNRVFKKKIVPNKVKGKNDLEGIDNNNKLFMFNLNQFKVDLYKEQNYNDKDEATNDNDDPEPKPQIKIKRAVNANQCNINSNNSPYKHKSNECNCNKVIINNVNNNSNNNIIIQTPKIEKLGDEYFNTNNHNAIYKHKNTKSDNYDFSKYNNEYIDHKEERPKDDKPNYIVDSNDKNEKDSNEEREGWECNNKQIKIKHKAKGTFASLQIKSDKKKSPINKTEQMNDLDYELASQSNQITDFQKSLYTQQIPPQKKQQQKQNTLNHYASFVSQPYTTNPINEEDYSQPLSSQINQDNISKPKRRKSTDLPRKRNQTILLNLNPIQSPPKDISSNDDNDANDVNSNEHFNKAFANIKDIDEDIELHYLSKLAKLKHQNEELKTENQSLIEKAEQQTKDYISQKSSYDSLLFEYDVIVKQYEELKAKCKQEDNDKTDINQIKSELKTKCDKVIELNNKLSELESIMKLNEQKAIDEKNTLREIKLNHDSLKSSYLDIKNQYDVMALKIQSLNEENFSLKREFLLLKTNSNATSSISNQCSTSNHSIQSMNKNNSNFYSENPNSSVMNIVKDDNQSSTFKKNKKSQMYNSNNDYNDSQQFVTSNDRIKRKNTSQNDSSNVSSLLTCGNIQSRNDNLMPIKRHDTSMTQAQAQIQQEQSLQSQSQVQSQSQSTSITGTFRKRLLNPSITNSNISIMPCQIELLQKESKINQLENDLFQWQTERTRYNDELNKLPEHPKQKAQILQKKNIEIQISELNVKINQQKKVLRELTKPIY